MASLADWIKNQTADYGQLKEAYPNAIKFGSALKKGISDIIPTTQELQNPQILSERALNYINPIAGTTKIANNLNSDLLKKYLSTGKLLPDEMTMYDFDNILFNGSSSPINQILPKNELEKKGIYTLFDGVFSHPDINIASSHGDIINRFVPRKNAIAKGSLDWNHEYDDILKEIKQMYPHASDADIEEVLYPAIVDDKNIWNMDEDLVSSATGKYDIADASWDMQNSRGKLANKLGYDAVGMNDEHGTSYLIPHGSKALIVDKNLNLINNNQKSLIDLLGKK